MKKFKRIIALFCCSVILLTACGSKEGETGAKPSDEGTKDITLNVTMWDYTSLEYHSKLVEAFEAEYPNVKVNVIESPAGDYSDKVAVMLSGDNDIDVIFVRDTASYTSMILKEQLEPLDTLIEENKIDLSAYGGMAEQYAIDGSIYGLPYRKDMWMLFYNKDLFDAAGIDYPSDNMTLKEYREIAKMLTSGEGNEKIYGAFNNKWTQSVSNLVMGTGNYDLMSGDYDFLIPYYDLVVAMQNEDKSAMDFSTMVMSNIHYSGPFYNGQVAMMPMGSWFINNMIENLANGTTSVNYDVAALPSLEGYMEGKGVGSILPVSVGANSKNKEWAWKFVEFVTTEKGAMVLADSGIMPAYNSDSVLTKLTENEGFPEHGKDLLLNTTDITIEFPLGDKWNSISKIMSEEHELIMLNSNSVIDGINAMKKRVEVEVFGN